MQVLAAKLNLFFDFLATPAQSLLTHSPTSQIRLPLPECIKFAAVLKHVRMQLVETSS